MDRPETRDGVNVAGSSDDLSSPMGTGPKKEILSAKDAKTINSRYSLVVTHPTTNLPAHGLSTTERTGSSVFHVLWSIAMREALDFYLSTRNSYCSL
jgi:hypothetical protein